MSMTKLECTIGCYMARNEQQLWNKDAFEYDVLEALGDLDRIVDFMTAHQDEINSSFVDSMVEKYK